MPSRDWHTEPQPEPLQQDTPPAFGGSIWSGGRKVMVTGNSLDARDE